MCENNAGPIGEGSCRGRVRKFLDFSPSILLLWLPHPGLTPPYSFHLCSERVITILGILEVEPAWRALAAVATLVQWKMENVKVPMMGVINAVSLLGVDSIN